MQPLRRLLRTAADGKERAASRFDGGRQSAVDRPPAYGLSDLPRLALRSSPPILRLYERRRCPDSPSQDRHPSRGFLAPGEMPPQGRPDRHDRQRLDYGCGRGEDVQLLAAERHSVQRLGSGFRPNALQTEADVVTWAMSLTSSRSAGALGCPPPGLGSQPPPARGCGPGGHGWPRESAGRVRGRDTNRDWTFQKIYDQGELKNFLEEQLDTEAIPAAPGVSTSSKMTGHAKPSSRISSVAVNPAPQAGEGAPEAAGRAAVRGRAGPAEPLMAAVGVLGRLPEPEEFPEAAAVADRFGSLKRAFALVRRVTGEEEWEAIRKRRIEDLLVYLALSRFRKRPTLTQLPSPRPLRAARACSRPMTCSVRPAERSWVSVGRLRKRDSAR